MSADRKSNQAEPKRGRGRPRLPNALTPAQRAKRYRDNKRARLAAAPSAPPSRVQPVDGGTEHTAEELLAENSRLVAALETARIRINDLSGALEFFVAARAKNKRISAEQLKGLHALLALGNPLIDSLFP
ncbi:hypothetical protein [Noviherbaspirillum autotrophicum]|uniref:Uncharacterized protein n=1 Tax=Noviherbaspirillum autotrophicum TaxID=709839 RepID=A0A0C2BIX3_9BURK|nr:hypothetical protein [Noviherbaspirillum autotrophicum]KIF79924.1 hypothetical protein TSA66_02290 [Noviherbaspirillum autotrophicum]